MCLSGLPSPRIIPARLVTPSRQFSPAHLILDYMAKKSSSIAEFTIRAKSILLREDRGDQLHAQWLDKIDALRAEGMTQKRATVLASEDFLCLT